MPSPALLPSLLDTIDTLTNGLIGGQLTNTEWHNGVARELFAHHLAEYASASGRDEEDVLERVKGIVGKHVDYLNAFTDQIEAGDYEDREDALRARAALYAGPLKTTQAQGTWDDWDIPPELLPGNQECMGNCLCTIFVSDNGDGTGTLTRTMGGTEKGHCDECPPLEGEHTVNRRDA